MKILGLNGWPERSHDASACLLVDGKIVAFAEEERFLRRKHAYDSAPWHAAEFCLRHAGMEIEALDVVALGWDLPAAHRRHGIPWKMREAEALEALLPRSRFPRSMDPDFHFVPHHLAHAASCYYLSGYDSAAILVIDGQGETESTTFAVGRGSEIVVIRTLPVSWSLGYFYESVCRHIGFRTSHAGKLMGLAPHGNAPDAWADLGFSGYRVPFMAEDLRNEIGIDDQYAVTAEWLAHFETRMSLRRNNGRADPFDYRNFAAWAQQQLELSTIRMVDELMEVTEEHNLAVAGGVGLNATLNGKLLDHPKVRRMFVQPVAHDAGVSLGAAAYVAAGHGDRIERMPATLSWGPAFDADAIAATLSRQAVPYRAVADPARRCAERIAGGEIVGWFQGRAEVGPRALGNRSILSLPHSTRLRDRINGVVKDRERWRPLGPSMLLDDTGRYVDADVPLPYMVTTRPVRESAAEAIAGVVHVDGTTRPQTVAAGDNHEYTELLKHLRDLVGHPVVLNTSFNGKDEPIVCTPRDALQAFDRLQLDALFLGPFELSKT